MKRGDSVVSSVNTDYTLEDATPSVIGTDYDGCSQRDSLVFNLTDDSARSVCGTEYEGDNSQRSSLTSSNEEEASPNRAMFEMDCGYSGDDIMVPAIHITETDDITTVIQASTKFPSPKLHSQKSTGEEHGIRRDALAQQQAVGSSEGADTRAINADTRGNVAEHRRIHDAESDATSLVSYTKAVDQVVPSVSDIVSTYRAERTNTHPQEASGWIEQHIPTIQLMVNRFMQEVVKNLIAEMPSESMSSSGYAPVAKQETSALQDEPGDVTNAETDQCEDSEPEEGMGDQEPQSSDKEENSSEELEPKELWI